MADLNGSRQRRNFEEVARDVIINNGRCYGCNAGHCIFRQILSHNGCASPSETCCGREFDNGCLIKRNALSLQPSSRDLVYHAFLAESKFRAGEILKIDIKSTGAEFIFNLLHLKESFDRAFERYTSRQINLDAVYNEVMGVVRESDFTAVLRGVPSSSYVFEERGSGVTSSFFG